MGDLAVLVAFLVVFGERAAEQLFGAFVKGWPMQFLAPGATVGVAVGTKLLAPEVPFPEFDWGKTVVIGVFSGLFGTAWHDWLSGHIPGLNRVSLSSTVVTIGKALGSGGHSSDRPPSPPGR